MAEELLALLPTENDEMRTKKKFMGKLDGKIALITGGNSGIGLATAKQFVSERAYVFITARREPELAVAVKDIGQTETRSWNHARETAGNVERGSFRISLESYTQIISKSPGLCEIPATVFRITVP